MRIAKLCSKKKGLFVLFILAMCLFAQIGFAEQETILLDHKQIRDACMHGVPLTHNTYRVWVWGREAAALTVEIDGREHRLKSNPKAGKQAYAWKQVGNYTHQGGETTPLRIHVDGRPFYLDPEGIGWLAFSPNQDWDPQAWFNQAKVFPHSARHVEDKRTGILREIRALYTFPCYKSKKAWLQRKSELRDHLLVTMGCYPEPPKTPLKPHVFDKMQFADYSIEKVYFESLPGFYVTGNLYRPVGKRGPFPGMLCPHGHWGEGRLTHTDNNSIPTRCINFAKQGYVVFAIDMIGYNDSLQLTHKFGGKPEWLWGLSLHGLQYWNSVRAIDFLLTLEDVNKKRIAVTGASGGGTQTYTLMAVDERVQYAAPVNMLSAHFQGGCLCENAPNLRIDAFNLEFGAMMAPRHLMMIAATGDWTAETPRVEYPAIRTIYKLFNKEERVRMQQFEAPHNYNQASREAVYQAFGEWILNEKDADQFKEIPIGLDNLDRLSVFPDGLPAGAKKEEEIVADWKTLCENQLREYIPNSRANLGKLQKTYGTALRHVVGAEQPHGNDLSITRVETLDKDEVFIEKVIVGREGVGDRIPGILMVPENWQTKQAGAILISEQGRMDFFSPGSPSHGGELLDPLVKQGYVVFMPDLFLTGEFHSPFGQTARNRDTSHFLTYNQTDTALRIQDILTSIAYLQSRFEVQAVGLVGKGNAGLWGLAAAALADDLQFVVADANGFDPQNDERFLDELFIPGLKRAGHFHAVQAMIAPTPLLVHNTQNQFPTKWAQMAYKTRKAANRLVVKENILRATDLSRWIDAR